MSKDDELNPIIKEPIEINKEVNIQSTGRQLILPLPALFVQILDIKKGDKFIIKANVKNKTYSIKLKKNE